VKGTVAKLRTEHNISATEALKLAAQNWKALKEEEKGPYQKLHDDDAKRHEAQLKELSTKGYFIMADGTKSSAIESSTKKRKTHAPVSPPAKRKSAASKKA